MLLVTNKVHQSVHIIYSHLIGEFIITYRSAFQIVRYYCDIMYITPGPIKHTCILIQFGAYMVNRYGCAFYISFVLSVPY